MKSTKTENTTAERNLAGDVQGELRALSDPEKARHLMRFFKTGPGEYGEGDRFLGIRVPKQRIIARKYRMLPLDEVAVLVRSEFHEERLTGLLILTYRYPKAVVGEKKAIYEFYIAHIPWINNWDLVDAHDLIHKAVGWMLREAGKRKQDVLISFLEEHSHRMPRTMLRYAIERLTESQRQAYLRRGK